MRFSEKFYVLLTISAHVFLMLILAGAYLDARDALSILVLLSPAQLGLWFMLGSIVLYTVGIVGIIRQNFKNHKNLLSALALLLIPPLIFVTFVFAFSSIYLNAPMSLMRSEITKVTVVDTNPLVLSLNVRAITSRDTRIESALVLNNEEVVAKVPSEEEWEAELVESGQFFTLVELPGGSEISFTLDFDTAVPSGDYLVRLSAWHYNHGESFFTIP